MQQRKTSETFNPARTLPVEEFVAKFLPAMGDDEEPTKEYLRKRHAWENRPTKDNWKIACKAYKMTKTYKSTQ